MMEHSFYRVIFSKVSGAESFWRIHILVVFNRHRYRKKSFGSKLAFEQNSGVFYIAQTESAVGFCCFVAFQIDESALELLDIVSVVVMRTSFFFFFVRRNVVSLTILAPITNQMMKIVKVMMKVMMMMMMMMTGRCPLLLITMLPAKDHTLKQRIKTLKNQKMSHQFLAKTLKHQWQTSRLFVKPNVVRDEFVFMIPLFYSIGQKSSNEINYFF